MIDYHLTLCVYCDLTFKEFVESVGGRLNKEWKPESIKAVKRQTWIGFCKKLKTAITK